MLQYNIDLNGKTILVIGVAGFIANNLMPVFALNSNRGYTRCKQLAQDNLDFLARTLRRQDY